MEINGKVHCFFEQSGTFKNSVVPYDGNLTNYPKETKELLKLCKRACERIAKEIA